MAYAEFEADTFSTPDESIAVSDIESCWNALSHFPDRRARCELRCLAERLNGFVDAVEKIAADKSAAPFDIGAEVQRFADRHIGLTRAFWHSESRCASSFIVGPSNFPGRVMEKRGQWATNRCNALLDHPRRALRSVERLAYPFGDPRQAIRSNHPQAVELLNRKIVRLRRLQLAMKAINAAHSAYARDPQGKRARELMGDLSAGAQETVMYYKPVYSWEPHPIAPWQLSNLGAQIRQAESRLTDLQRMRETGPSESEREGVRIVENVDAARLQLVFPGKPDDATRALLKSLGFRWSPREGAWQRHLNNAGRDAAQTFFRKKAA